MNDDDPDLRAVLVVCERRPRWLPELQRRFDGEPVRVRGCVHPRDLDAACSVRLPCTAVVDLETGPADILRWLARRCGRLMRPATVLLGSDPAFAPLEWSFREFGAVGFFVGVPSGADLASLCRRQWEAGFQT